jgi:hypothetical protein
MALFQPAVLKKYVSGINEQEIEEVWGRFTAHFHNPEIQKNFRGSKEEEYQDGFLTNLIKLTLNQFPADLQKKKVILSHSEEAKADELKSQIAQTDSEIDEMVYELYELGNEERNVVERI